MVEIVGVQRKRHLPRPTLGVGNWTYSGLDSSYLESGTSYYITARGLDAAINTEDWYSIRGSTFTFDNIGPLSKIIYPATSGSYSSLGTISGTSYDATSGPSRVSVSVRDLDGGTSDYWTNLGWQTNVGEYWTDISTTLAGGSTFYWQYYDRRSALT